MLNTKIDWADSTWSPVTGCLHGCEYCYARGIAKRFGKNLPDLSDFASKNKGLHLLDNKIDSTPYPFGFEPTFHAYRLNDYIGKKGRNIFVCSMADLFGSWVPDSWIEEVFAACEKAPQNNYLFLTKNPARYSELANGTDFFAKTGNNMWFGFSYTGRNSAQWWNPDYNIFASVEPILERVDMPKCKWLIVGAETGNRKGKVVPEREWIEHLLAQCRQAHVPVFMKSNLVNIWEEPLIQEYPSGMWM